MLTISDMQLIRTHSYAKSERYSDNDFALAALEYIKNPCIESMLAS